ncbi:MAG: S-layer homology domain-containing protein [Clostridia bacterium]|nr:S-layer homology domain-containing protein [Clostridia bacterium]
MKRFLSGFFSLLLLLTCVVPVSAAQWIATTPLSENSLEFSIENTTLTIFGSILCDRLEKVRLGVGTEERFLTVSSSEEFSESFSLSGMEDIPVTVYTKKSGEELYWSYIWQTLTIEATETGYRFTDTPVYDHNRAMLDEHWINPADHLASAIDPAVQEKSAEIVGEETDPYRKLLRIHRWVADNLYYDNDYAAGRTETTPLTPAEVLAAGYSVCQGYANLVQALCQAQGIPCMVLATWGAGTGTDGFISAEDDPFITESNHAHAAAWVDGRWVHMDTTWDSPNRYENGIKTKGTSSGILYFDSQLNFFSRNHKIIAVPAASADNTPSEWAIWEVKLALERELVPFTLQKNYRTPITRAQFCQLLMTMLLRRMDADSYRYTFGSLQDLIDAKELTIDETIFTDIADLPNRLEILTANALGIVNGRGGGIFDPHSGITRQEAATMLMRAAQVLKIPMGENPRSFSDMADADEWAAMGILYTSSLTDASGMAVMGGVDASRFSPKTAYTVEQSILTMVRMSTVGSAYIP